MIDSLFLSENYGLETVDQEAIYESNSKLILRAKSKPLGNLPVALKFSKLNPEFIDSYISNFKVLSGLRPHSNVLGHYQIFELADSPINYDVLEVLELVHPIPLKEIFKVGSSPVKMKKMVLKLLEGFHFLHTNGILHRDVKPDNILMIMEDESYELKIIDFDFMSNSTNQKLVTTPEFLAPEVNSYSDYNVKAEIWSIGMVLYLIFGGRMPFRTRKDNLSIEEVKTEVINCNIDFSKIPPPLRLPLSLCLKKDPKDRIGSLGQLILSMDPVYFFKYWFKKVFNG